MPYVEVRLDTAMQDVASVKEMHPILRTSLASCAPTRNVYKYEAGEVRLQAQTWSAGLAFAPLGKSASSCNVRWQRHADTTV